MTTADTSDNAHRLSYQPKPEKQAEIGGAETAGCDVSLYSGEFYSYRFTGGDGHQLVRGFRIASEWTLLERCDRFSRNGDLHISGGVFGRTKFETLALALAEVAGAAKNANRVARIARMLLSVEAVEDNCADIGDIMHSADLEPMAGELSDWAFQCQSILEGLSVLIAAGHFAEDSEAADKAVPPRTIPVHRARELKALASEVLEGAEAAAEAVQ
jgi:hypothetical protein